MEKFNGYVAQVYVMMGLIKGRTMLPLPSNKLTSSGNILILIKKRHNTR
jgi:hypothetical protein